MLNYAVSWLLGALLSWEVFLFFPLFFFEGKPSKMMMMMILTGCCLARAAREHGPYPPSSVTNGMMLIVLAMGRRRRTTGPGLATRHTTVSLCLSLSSYTALFHYILMTVLVCRTSSRLVPVLLCCANSLCQSVSRREAPNLELVIRIQL